LGEGEPELPLGEPPEDNALARVLAELEQIAVELKRL
jgi:hypothetical protein